MRKIVYDIVRLKYSLHLMMRIILQRVLKKMKEHLCPNVSMAMIIESYLKLWTHKPHCIDKEGLLVDWQPCTSPSCTGISPWLCYSSHVCAWASLLTCVGHPSHFVDFFFSLVWALFCPRLFQKENKKTKIQQLICVHKHWQIIQMPFLMS